MLISFIQKLTSVNNQTFSRTHTNSTSWCEIKRSEGKYYLCAFTGQILAKVSTSPLQINNTNQNFQTKSIRHLKCERKVHTLSSLHGINPPSQTRPTFPHLCYQLKTAFNLKKNNLLTNHTAANWSS